MGTGEGNGGRRAADDGETDGQRDVAGIGTYRRGELSTLVERLITEMNGRQSQKNAIERSPRQSGIP